LDENLLRTLEKLAETLNVGKSIVWKKMNFFHAIEKITKKEEMSFT